MTKKRIWLIEKRLRKGLNQLELAQKCNVSNQTISNIENGNRAPSGVLAKKIADILEFDMSLFYQDERSA